MSRSEWLLKEAVDEILVKEAGPIRYLKGLGEHLLGGAKRGFHEWRLDRHFTRYERTLRKIYRNLTKSGHNLGMTEDQFVEHQIKNFGKGLGPAAEELAGEGNAVVDQVAGEPGTFDKAVNWMKEHPWATAGIGLGAGVGGGLAVSKLFSHNNNQY